MARTGGCGCSGPHCDLSAGDRRHGTGGGYTNHYCRCDACRTAAITYHREWKKTSCLRIPNHVHGTCNGYGNWGCHCTDCRKAWADYARARYHQGRTAKG